MSKTNWTAGEWQVRKWDGDTWPENRISVGPQNSHTATAVAISPKFANKNQAMVDFQLMAASKDLYAALEESVKDLVAAQVNSRKAAKHDHNWEGVSEAIQPSVDRARAALEKARGES